MYNVLSVFCHFQNKTPVITKLLSKHFIQPLRPSIKQIYLYISCEKEYNKWVKLNTFSKDNTQICLKKYAKEVSLE